MNKYKGLLIKKILPLLVFSLALEVFAFNYRHWESLVNGEKPQKPLQEQIAAESGFRENGDGTLTLVEPEAGIVITDINRRLKTAYIEIQVLNKAEEEPRPVVIRQWVTDESHRFYYEIPQREIWETEKRSSYMTYHLYGECKSLRIVPDLEAGQVISFQIVLNPRIPLFFSWGRFFVLFFISGLICALKPSSVLHSISYLGLSVPKRKTLLVLFFFAHLLLFWQLTHVNPYFQEETAENQKQYQELTESLKAGSFAVLEEPAKSLVEMENPYDKDYRDYVTAQAGEDYKWDHAYYQGKYYVYFGVVPVILFYLPYYAVTGTHLHNCTAIFALSLLFLLGIMGTLHEIIRKWFPRTSVAIWFMLSELLILGSGLVYMAKRPDLYAVPILSGLAFGMLGLWCFFLAGKKEGGALGYLGLGSLLISLIAGCRPQLFLFALPAVLLLWDMRKRAAASYTVGTVRGVEIRKSGREEKRKKSGEGEDGERKKSGGGEKGGRKKNGKKWAGSLEIAGQERRKEALLALLLPVILVAAAIMYYNNARFGSPFDFGANYNLTFNDMRNRGFNLDRIPLGILAYLFQPVKLIQSFPFLEAVYFDSQYMGVTIQEATYGGIFMTNLFAWFSLVPLAFHRRMRSRDKTLWLICIAFLASAGIIIVADTNMSGILQRYFGDFSLLIMLAAAFSTLWLLSQGQFSGGILRRMLLWALLLCLLHHLCWQGMTFFLDTGEALREYRPDLYSHVKYLTAFWL
ncbi:MAG: hypothetical protein NC400_11825 [Clostridium sp.]|nr:hypothetical protein [Clostridium sp.]